VVVTHAQVKNERWNLKLPVAALLLFSGIGPLLANFIYSIMRLRNLGFRSATAGDLGFLGDKFEAECILAGCILTFPVLLAISRSPTFARLCSRDPERVSQTISAARLTSWIVAAIALVSIVFIVHELLS
jgi:hypothetical protein